MAQVALLHRSLACFVRDRAAALDVALPPAWGPLACLLLLCSVMRREGQGDGVILQAGGVTDGAPRGGKCVVLCCLRCVTLLSLPQVPRSNPHLLLKTSIRINLHSAVAAGLAALLGGCAPDDAAGCPAALGWSMLSEEEAPETAEGGRRPRLGVQRSFFLP